MYDRYCIKCHMYTIIIISLPAQVLPLFPLVTGRLRARLCNFESHTSCSRRTPLIAFLLTLLLLLLSRFSRVRLCATPETAAHQAPPSLGFSRQEHWSGLPFPSPKAHLRKNLKLLKSCHVIWTQSQKLKWVFMLQSTNICKVRRTKRHFLVFSVQEKDRVNLLNLL